MKTRIESTNPHYTDTPMKRHDFVCSRRSQMTLHSLLLLSSLATITAKLSQPPLFYRPGSTTFSQLGLPDKLLGLEVWSNDNDRNDLRTIKAWFRWQDLELPVYFGDPHPTGTPILTTDLLQDNARMGCVELGHTNEGSIVSLAYCIQQSGPDSSCEPEGPLGDPFLADKLKLSCIGGLPTDTSVRETIQGESIGCQPN